MFPPDTAGMRQPAPTAPRVGGTGRGIFDGKAVSGLKVRDKAYGKTRRKNFARYEEVMEMPNLLEIQKSSYRWFLDTGLREVFADVAAITDNAGTRCEELRCGGQVHHWEGELG